MLTTGPVDDTEASPSVSRAFIDHQGLLGKFLNRASRGEGCMET